MKTTITTLLIAVLAFSMQAQELKDYIPSNTMMIAKVNGKTLNDKAAISYIEQLPMFQEFFLNINYDNPQVKNMEDLGIDLAKDAYSFGSLNDSLSIGYILMPLKSVSNWESKMLGSESKKAIANRVIVDNDLTISWNDKMVVFAFGELNFDYLENDSLFEQKYGFSPDYYDYEYDYGYNSYYEDSEVVEVYQDEEASMDAAGDAVDAAKDASEAADASKYANAADAVGDATYYEEEVEVEESYTDNPTKTYQYDGVTYYMDGTPAEQDYYGNVIPQEDLEPKTPRKKTTEYYNHMMDSLSNAWRINSVQELMTNGSTKKSHSPKVSNVINSKSDASLYIDYAGLMGSYASLFMSELGSTGYDMIMHDGLKLYEGSELVADLNFNKGNIDLHAEYSMNDELGEITGSILNSKFNKKFLKQMDMDNMLGFYSMSINTEPLIKAYYKVMGSYMYYIEPGMNDGITDLIDIFVDEKGISELLSGKAVVLCDGFTKQKVSQISYEYDDDYNRTETVTESESDLPSVLMMLECKRTDVVSKFLSMGESKDVFSKTSYGFTLKPTDDLPVLTHIILKDDMIYICNDENRMKQIVSGKSIGSVKGKFKKSLKKNAIMAFVDGQKVMDAIPYKPYSEKDIKSWEMVRERLGDLSIAEYQKDNNTVVYEMKLTTPEAAENTWKYFWDSINEFYIIDTGN